MTDQNNEEKVKVFQCPNCDAGLTFNPKKQKFCCEYCFSEFDEEDLTPPEEDAEEEKAAGTFWGDREAPENDRAGAEDEAFSAQMRAYICPNCGAEIVADESTAADFCYYCHNPVVLSGKLSGAMKPHRIIPFKYDRDAAKETFLGWASKKKFAPDDFSSPKQIENMQGVYFPFWVTDADTESEVTAHATRVRVWTRGGYRYTQTSHFRVWRRGNLHFEDIVTLALSDADKKMLESVLPYPSDVHQDFSMPYLSGFVAKKRDLERTDVSDEVGRRMNGYAKDLLGKTIRGYSSVDIKNVHVDVQRDDWSYTLMPIWILTYRDKKSRVYTYAMNGFTGKLYGEVPLAMNKLLGFAAGLLAGLTAILTVIGGLLL